ncbi:AAA family ATPase [Corynebacterium glyciniphilum]|uniref:AAA family ATPase n=1 Tax=Corynebacterium glyciniphilum TaxID=1404244 RepID=UPI003DA17AB0
MELETTGDAFMGVQNLATALVRSLEQVVRGKRRAIDAVVTTLLAGGHVLLEDVPGVGKTTLASSVAASVDAQVRRLQFTSDMMPTDVTGVAVYDDGSQEFNFHRGPIFTNIAIADEVNRATPRAQSALLEAMAERSVSVDGTTYALPELFIVVATQNPQDMEGTFPLPEAQRDRFMTRISLGYPDESDEAAMVTTRSEPRDQTPLTPVASVAEVLEAQKSVRQVAVADEVARYIVKIVAATRIEPEIRLGGSPRATLHLTQMSKARAAMRGRSYVIPDDAAALAGMVLPHRLALNGRFSTLDDAHATAARLVAGIVATVRPR